MKILCALKEKNDCIEILSKQIPAFFSTKYTDIVENKDESMV